MFQCAKKGPSNEVAMVASHASLIGAAGELARAVRTRGTCTLLHEHGGHVCIRLLHAGLHEVERTARKPALQLRRLDITPSVLYMALASSAGPNSKQLGQGNRHLEAHHVCIRPPAVQAQHTALVNVLHLRSRTREKAMARESGLRSLGVF